MRLRGNREPLVWTLLLDPGEHWLSLKRASSVWPELRLPTHRMKSKLLCMACRPLSLRSSCLSRPTYLPLLTPRAQAVSSPAISWTLHAVSCFCNFTPALALLGKPLLLVGYVDVFIPGSLSLRAHLHLEGLLGLPRWSECFLLGAPTWSCSALTAPITNGTDMYVFISLGDFAHSLTMRLRASCFSPVGHRLSCKRENDTHCVSLFWGLNEMMCVQCRPCVEHATCVVVIIIWLAVSRPALPDGNRTQATKVSHICNF